MKQLTFKHNAYFSRTTFFFVAILLFVFTKTYSSENEKAPLACTATIVNTFPYSESFEANVGDWIQSPAPANGDTGNWKRDANGTPSNNTGPSKAAEGTFYLFTEASNTAGSNVGNNGQASLTSPCFDLTSETSAFFSFSYHMFGFNMGSLAVEISDTAGASWTQVFVRAGQQHTSNAANWTTENIDLAVYLGSTINIRIIGSTGNGYRSDMAIDNVSVATTPLYCPSSASPTDTFNDGITEVLFNTINNTSATANYTDFTGISTTIEQGSTHELNVRINNPGNNNFIQRAWIDWNQDFVFDDTTESYDLGAVTTNGNNQLTSNSPLTITVPTTAQLGNTRMRVANAFNLIPDPCGTFNFGEVEDYTINVTTSEPRPEMDVSGLSISILNNDILPSTTDDTDFGTVAVGNSNSHIFTITNSGNLDLNLTGASPYVTITGASNFSLTAIPSTIIAAGGGTTTFEITYTPTNTTPDTAMVSIANDDADKNPYNFTITGIGEGPEPEIGLTGLGNNILDGDTTPTTVDGTDFGILLTGDSTFRDFIINNTGDLELNLTGSAPYVTITGPGAGEFMLTTAPTTPIPTNGGTATFRVTYNPSVDGTHNATITIANDDSNEDPYNYDITGFASATLAPEINILGAGNSITDGDSTPSVADGTDFSIVEIGTSNTNDFIISNTGTGLLTLTGSAPYVTITGPDASEFLITTIPDETIASFNATIFQISYTPSSPGNHSASISIANDDANADPYNFNISGEAITPVNRLVTPYYENFDANQGDWTISNPGGQTVWTYGQNAGETTGDGNYFYTSVYNDYANNSDTYATSPIIDLTGFIDLRFQIDIRTSLNNDVDDAMNIEYSDNGGASWTVLGTATEPEANGWYNETNADGLGTDADGWSGINSSIFNASKSQFSLSYIDLPSSLENNPQTQFRVRFASDNDTITDDGANFDNIIITGNPITPLENPNQGPSNVTSNLHLWLKSNAGLAMADGTQAVQWTDQARDNDARIGNENAPLYYNNATENINHNPVLAFSEANRTELKGKGGYFSKDYWIVMKQDGIIDGTTAGAYEGIVAGRKSDSQFSEDGSGFWTGNISVRFNGQDNMLSHMIGTTPSEITTTTANTSYGKAYSSSTDSYEDEVVIVNIKTNSSGTSSEIYKNGIKVDNTDAFAFNQSTGTIGDMLSYTDFANSNFALGVSYAGLNRNDISTWFNGKMTEFISYSISNSVFDQKRIQSYLAIKNGVTLHSINSTTVTRECDEDYIDSAGQVIWDYETHAGFNYDIAGIGSDIGSELNQKQSTSSNAGATVTMGLTDIFETNSDNISLNPNAIPDQNFLLWGNNNDTFNASSPIHVDMSADINGLSTSVDFRAVKRTWKVVEKGAVSEVTVSVPEIALAATLTSSGSYLMLISDTPTFNPNSKYVVMSRNGDNLEASYDFDGVKYITFGYATEYFFKRSITFDGVRDYLDVGDELDRTGSFTISAWIKRIDGDYSIISKRNAAFTEGYDISLLNDKHLKMSWINELGTQNIQSSIQIPENEWHQFAFTYDGAAEARIYIDGVLDKTETLSPPIANNQSFIIGAADGTDTTDFFLGTLDELRIWDMELTQNQVRYIMNQEIEENTDFTVGGQVVPTTISKNEFSDTAWSNLAGYFPMNSYAYTNIKDQSGNNLVAAIKNLETVDFQTAPLPYQSMSNGNWSEINTWENGTTQELPGAPSISDPSLTIDWNIVQTAHNITTNANNTVLSLEVMANELSIENDSKMEVSHYLRLDGVMDLVDESQLVQTENSELDIASIGNLEKDQQGTSDTYTYNYWSSPVSTVNTTANNQDYSVSEHMLDGSTSSNPLSMLFTDGYNGAAGTPITISSAWLYKFTNDPAGDYSSWQYVGASGSLKSGEGYSMKGPGTGGITTPQNYTFKGKPNNSTDTDEITLSIDAGNQYLIGNPFPSALDANDFITDNPHLNGTLYFWQHWGGGTHVLTGYQGGYATYTLAGGVPAVSHPSVDQTGSGTVVPERYIPVGQGFFTQASSTGTIVLNNSQRNFVKETSESSFFFSPENRIKNTTATAENPNVKSDADMQLDDSYYDGADLRKKISITFDSPQQFHRELLLTIDDRTTMGYDRMYDGINAGGTEDDMKWMIGNQPAVIQAIPETSSSVELPLSLTTANAGISTITLSHIENEDRSSQIYLRDNLLQTLTNLKKEAFSIDLPPGDHNKRFYIVLKKGRSSTIFNDKNDDETNDDHTIISHDKPAGGNGGLRDHGLNDDDTPGLIATQEDTSNLMLSYDKRTKSLQISKNSDTAIINVSLYSVLGQMIKQWKPSASSTNYMELPVPEISIGAYLIHIETETGTVAQKIIIH